MSSLKLGKRRQSFFKEYFTSGILIVVLLFSVELTAYLKFILPRSLAELILFAGVFIAMFKYGRTHKIISNVKNPVWFCLFVYISMLFFRLVIDFVLPGKGFFLYLSPVTIIFFVICTIIVPSVFFCCYRFEFDIFRTAKFLSAILVLCISKSIYGILSGNAELNNDGRFDTEVFSITLGQFSASLILIGLYLLKICSTDLKTKLWTFICFIAGFVGIILSGSRGPFVSLAVCVLLFIASRMKRVSNLVFLLIVISVFWQLIGDVLMTLNDLMKESGFRTFDRVVTSIFSEDGIANHSSGRDSIYKEGIRLFLENPLFGNSFLIPNGIYVHNIIIEQYMATGIVGGTLFLGINIYTLLKGYNLMRKDKTFAIISILFLQYFLYGCLSVTILALFPYWIMLFIIVNRADTIQISKLKHD